VLKATASDIAKHYIIQLLNTENEVVRELAMHNEAEKILNVDKVAAGVYHIRVLEDTNADATWNTGHLLLRRQPEKWIEMQGTHTLKGGWDLEIEVKL
jgi:hypothetical protein